MKGGAWMNSIIELYKTIYKKVEDINAQIEIKKNEFAKLSKESGSHFSDRIENLETTLEKVDDYLLRVKGFQELAKKNLESTNVLTIEAPPGYRVNLNRLRNWAMLIDPTSSNDPYAQRVYVVAKCDECFLEQKKKEFTDRLEALKNADSNGITDELRQIENDIKKLELQLKEYSSSDEISDFANKVVLENEKYWFTKSPESFLLNNTLASIAPGAIMMPFVFHKDDKNKFKAQFGKFYDECTQRILLPFELSNSKDFIMTVFCSPSKSKLLDKGIQNILMTYINNNELGNNNIYIIDAARYNSSSLGPLRTIEGTVAINQIPRNPEQLTNALEGIIASFSDYDDIIELHDSIREYNDSLDDKNLKLPSTLLILYGWPNSYSKADQELVQKLVMNYERYGLSVITVSFSMNDSEIEKAKGNLPEYAANNAIKVIMKSKETTITVPEKHPRNFVWYTYNSELNSNYVEEIRQFKVTSNKKGNEYTTWFPLNPENLLNYTREYKPISLPFGMDGKENIHDISFENENFAAYLVGASRSGKSTLLHTLIAGIIRNYHPDNVELWLADFKQLEFKRYMNRLPPHVKYVLLDESEELVFDLIDRLTDEMLERQKLFSRMGKQRIDQVDTTKLEKPLPVIFVILDEFSIMSQSIAESPSYKLKLQNLLAKGAALGIKFLFSSQTFTTGVSGLTSTARAQIQQRISMKGAREEISETLELSSNLKTEQVKNWMDALPPHYALVKYCIGPDTPPQVKRFLVLYFKDYNVLDAMIDSINQNMAKSDEYNPTDIKTYMDKKPVLVDGNTFDAYNWEELTQFAKLHFDGSYDATNKEMLVSFGTPRLMSRVRFTRITNETRENILLVARLKEKQCTASIILSAIKSYQNQGGKAELWVYSKNVLLKEYKSVFEETGAKIIEDIDAVCDSIKDIKSKIKEKQPANTLVVLIGMDRICMDFDFVDDSDSEVTEKTKKTVAQQREQLQQSAAAVNSNIQEEQHAYAMAWIKERKAIKSLLVAEEKNDDEIKAILQEREAKFKKEYYASHGIAQDTFSVSIQPKSNNSPNNTYETELNNEQTNKTGAYNAQNDFLYIVKQGSRMGYHFMLCINDFSDLKICGFKNPDLFRYRLAFQLSVQDSRDLFSNKSASVLPEHICKYDNRLEQYSFRPYLHKGVGWDGWFVNKDGSVFNPYSEIDN